MNEIEINEIKIENSRRAIDDATVQKLAQSMEQVGLLNPITVDYENNLIAGAHRLAAAKKLGWERIPCTLLLVGDLQAKLAELDENLVRNQGNAIEQGEWLAEKKRIYERLHPETKATTGKELVQKRWNTSEENSLVQKDTGENLSFVSDTAEKTGLSKRTIEQSIQIAENLAPDVKEFGKEVDMGKTDALNLARKSPEEQREIVEPIRNAMREKPPEERKETAHNMLRQGLAPKPVAQIEYEEAIRSTYASAIKKPSHLEMKPENISIFYDVVERNNHVQMWQIMIERAIKNLTQLKEYFEHPIKVGGLKS